MSAITVTIENLKDGSIRATARHNGRTVSWKDGVNAKALIAEVMEITCPEHRIGNGYDFTYIKLNDAAKLALATNAVTVEAETEVEAGEKCKRVHGWTPDAIREVDSGWLDRRMWRCSQAQSTITTKGD